MFLPVQTAESNAVSPQYHLKSRFCADQTRMSCLSHILLNLSTHAVRYHFLHDESFVNLAPCYRSSIKQLACGNLPPRLCIAMGGKSLEAQALAPPSSSQLRSSAKQPVRQRQYLKPESRRKRGYTYAIYIDNQFSPAAWNRTLDRERWQVDLHEHLYATLLRDIEFFIQELHRVNATALAGETKKLSVKASMMRQVSKKTKTTIDVNGGFVAHKLAAAGHNEAAGLQGGKCQQGRVGGDEGPFLHVGSRSNGDIPEMYDILSVVGGQDTAQMVEPNGSASFAASLPDSAAPQGHRTLLLEGAAGRSKSTVAAEVILDIDLVFPGARCGDHNCDRNALENLVVDVLADLSRQLAQNAGLHDVELS